MSSASAKYLEKTLAGAALAALSPRAAVAYAAAMERRGPTFVLLGATPEELAEWKSSIHYLRVVVGGEPEALADA